MLEIFCEATVLALFRPFRRNSLYPPIVRSINLCVYVCVCVYIQLAQAAN